MLRNVSRRSAEPVLLDRRHQIQSSTDGLVTVFVWDRWQMSANHTATLPWKFSFKPEPGDVLAQVKRRLQQ